MSESFSYKLLSHPDEYLVNHLSDVATFSKNSILDKNLSFSHDLNEILPKVVFYLGACHDFGKGTSFFQEYIQLEDTPKKRSLKSNPLTKHGLISAVFAFYCVKQLLPKENNFDYLPLLSFLIVKRHHGNLDNPNFELSSIDDQQIAILQKQVEILAIDELIAIYSLLLPTVNINHFFSDFNNIIIEIKKGRRILRNLLGSEKSFQFYLLFQILYSTLLNADKMCASKLDVVVGHQRLDLATDYVDSYRKIMNWENVTTDKMNKLRNEVYQDINGKISSIDLKRKIFSMNIPTGMGKTLTSFSFALKLRQKIFQQFQYKPRIIYVLPFLSIIEQNYSVFEEVIRTVTKKEPTTNLLLKHHHLSEIFFSSKDEEFRDLDALLLMEGWNAEIIVSTFIQLFHTMISNRNHSLRKFHNLANSIIILDEIQSIPHKYWLLIKRLIEEIAVWLNSYFLIVSATLPFIFYENSNEIIELATNKHKTYSELDRILLQYNPQVMTLEEFSLLIQKEISSNQEKDFLVVLNTINSVKDLYHKLTKQPIEMTDYYFLSTHITPKERLERIESIKKNKKRKVVISTQLIEAGVDIDMDIVYRDIAPLDSINQVAGRCNRNYKKEKQVVNIVRLRDDKQEFYKYIYSAFLIDKTLEVINEFGTIIPESLFLEMNNSYYRKIKENQSNDEATKIISLIEELRFGDFYENFQLIAEDYEKKDIFIELDDRATKLWKEYADLKRMTKFQEQKKKFLEIKGEFYNYVISVPKSKVPASILDEEKNLGYISLRELPYYYDLETGFEPKQGGVLIF